MIIKSFEINKINLNLNKFFLFYGKNDGLKNELTKKIIKKIKISNYEEKEVLENKNNFIENLLTKSLFEEQKIIIIRRSTDKILSIIEDLHTKKIDDIIIINSDNLDKKSKLRSFFEKDKNLVCIPFYPDNDQTMSQLACNFLRSKNISISTSNINLIINKCGGDRENLTNELQKIEYFVKNG